MESLTAAFAAWGAAQGIERDWHALANEHRPTREQLRESHCHPNAKELTTSGHRLSYIGQRRGPWRAIPSSASLRLFFAADVVGYSRLMN